MKKYNKNELIKYFKTDNKSGYKTKKNHMQKKFVGLIEEIDEYNKKYFSYNDLSFTQKLYHYLYDIVEIPKCENCGNEIKWRNRFSEGYLKYCSKKCKNESKSRIERMKKTNISKYGVYSVLMVDSIKEKRKETIKKRFGVENIFENNEIKEKTKQTNLIKYGAEFPSQSDFIKNKIKENNLKKYGVEWYSQSSSLKEKYIKRGRTYFENKLKTKGYLVLDYLPDNIVKIKHPDGHIFEINRTICNNRFNYGSEISTKLLPVGGFGSTFEIEVEKFLLDNNIKYIKHDKNLLDGLELDFYLYENNLAIECNGLYWHSDIFKDKIYHLNKTILCENKGVQLIHIFEDEWKNKNEIVKSILMHKLNLIDNKIYARKCVIKEISSKMAYDFLEKNHIQGKINSKIKIGLFYNNNLVSIMTLGKKRIAMGSKNNNDDEYEMLRFCNSINTTVIGSASKLLNYFIKTYNPKLIISYADRRYSNGNLYKKLGFDFIGNTKPNYWYFKKNEIKRIHRFVYRKDVLIKNGYNADKTEIEIMYENGFLRIFDCGNIKFELNL